ncbi:MAG: hypothetical protein EZS28_023438 [Streblomastix strix]|uniref:Right handed beta helix domain-containing protein n=1 Tax=Streblomastix strix TaxID=222440 RepID=A0A5J4VF73_9EUKA|nr:MAG: hypothetical protein EZS28_023438 [Streblomastix strix]
MQDGVANQNGGVINANLVSSLSKLDIISCSFIECKSTNRGGALFLYVGNEAESTLRNLSFDQCEAQNSGGAIFIDINYGGKLTISGSSFSKCESLFGGSLYIVLESGGQMTINGSCLFTDCKTTSVTGQGGAIFAIISNDNSELVLEDSITFEKCSSVNGGGMSLAIQGKVKFTIFGTCQLTNCSSEQEGGGISMNIQYSNYDIQLLGSVQFEECKSGLYGGGLYIYSLDNGLITINQISFQNCNSTSYGGGFYSSLRYGAQMAVNQISFSNCNSTFGGGLNLFTQHSGSITNITGELQFEKCNAGLDGGGLCIIIEDSGIIEIRKASFTDCTSSDRGGGLFANISTGQFMISGTASFKNCNCSRYGGGLFVRSEMGIVNISPINQILVYNCSSENTGGGFYCVVESQGQISLNNTKFSSCISHYSGGGLLGIVYTGGQLILDQQCEFYKCESENGGGIHISIDLAAQCSFIIKDAQIHECKALNSTDSQQYSRSGFGGGMILFGYGDYDPAIEQIDLHGMKIYNNSADNLGQSLFVVMPQVAEFCKYGILGEYVKGNYSDTYSDERELVGISMNLTTFESSTQEQIEQQSQLLEPLWRILGILKSAQVIVNVSNSNGKLIFRLEGQKMIPGYLNVKIFELRNKTKEEIDQVQKEIKYKHNKNNLKSLKGTTQKSQITPKHQTDNQQQIFISSNLKIKQELHNYENEIIYPPEDGSSSPIQIKGEIPNDQKATFGMNEYKWLSYKEKVYAVLISNDRNIFTGKNGTEIEEDENAAVQLEVIIEDDVEKEEEEKDDKTEGK